MADQLYGYSSSYVPPSAESSLLGGSTTSRSISDSTLHRIFGSDISRSSMYLNRSDSLALGYSSSSSSIPYSSFLHRRTPWASGLDISPSEPLLPPGIKRPSEVPYHHILLNARNTIEQNEAWYSTTSSVKRSRLESTSNSLIYPQRPGEKDCAHYMMTRVCKYGDSCKFDHPIWVPAGGIPDWKEIPLSAGTESPPERPGQPDCPYYMKTQKCKFGSKCKFNHPKDKTAVTPSPGNAEASGLPERPSEPPCAFYLKTGKCKFGGTCKFHHPKDLQIASGGQDTVKIEQTESVGQPGGPTTDVKPLTGHNSKGLPIRLGEVDCPFYLKTSSCKYGASCRYSHPDRNALYPPASAIKNPFVSSDASNLSTGVLNPANLSALAQAVLNPHPALGVIPSIYPQRPGQAECDYYMKKGECKYGERCRFHHPIDRSAVGTEKKASEQPVKLTAAGLPRREGATHCPYYMKTGICKYGSTCKFDHPPPGEVMAMAAAAAAAAAGTNAASAAAGDEEAKAN